MTEGETPKLSAAEKKKLRRKRAKEEKRGLKAQSKEVHEALHQAQAAEQSKDKRKKAEPVQTAGDLQVVVDYVSEPVSALDELKSQVEDAAREENPYSGIAGLSVSDSDEKSEALKELERIAARFVPEAEKAKDEEEEADVKPEQQPEQPDAGQQDEEENDEDAKALSNRQIKLQRNEATSQVIAQLKQECPRPEVVEVWDIRARDPKLLVYLKSYRNTVPVPRHWSQKRKYLQGKRGIEKPPFELPSFIQETGISDMRNALEQRVEDKLKNKGRQRMRPKMGKMEIDYKVLHDAFFKFQEKPKMTGLGDLYYEGKEYEMKHMNAYPGILSPELKEALGMAELSPPPWLINMQRYGPPPSYPTLKIPGLNAPIPPGAHFGFDPGCWGKPPVDERGEPLYGDVFGVNVEVEDDLDPEVKQQRWGDLEEDEDESSEEESSEEEPEQPLTAEQMEAGIASGMMTGLTTSLTQAGIETDQSLELRKAGGTASTPSLYTVLEQQAAGPSEGLTAVGHTYKVPGGGAGGRQAQAAKKRLEGLQPNQDAQVDLAIDPEDLERLGEKGLEQLYQQNAGGKKEDYSDMVAANQAARKRKAQEQAAAKAKKAKETFKF